MHSHDHYKELCAIAFSGQLRPPEQDELRRHIATCEECRGELGDFYQIVTGIQALSDWHRPLEVPAGMTERFLARARSEGIPLGRKIEKHTFLRKAAGSRTVGIAIAALLAFGIATFLISRRVAARMQDSPPRTVASGVQPDSERARQEMSQELLSENAHLKEEIQRIQNQVIALSRQVRTNRDLLKTRQSEKADLGARLADKETSANSLRQSLASREQEVAQLKSDLEKVKGDKDAEAIVSQAQENELRKLHEQMSQLEIRLQESEQLSAAADQAKELIVARNLHIVDVDDTDENGRRQRPFGRIFYAEGKKLIFYAYDLYDPRKLNAEINFHVWGSREGADKPVKNLGIFHEDDVAQGRWVLKFDDPNVLAQINCVFVTAESDRKTVTNPTGRQILFASLGKTNHP